jgi:serine protease Do
MRKTNSLALYVVLAVAVFGCRNRNAGDDAGVDTTIPSPTRPTTNKPIHVVYPAAPGSFVDLVVDERKAVVNIRSTTKAAGGPATIFPGEEGDYSLGSGFLWDADGYVITNDHVIANARDPVVVLADGSELAAQIIGRDPKLDVAILKIDSSPRYHLVRPGDSESLQIGEWILVLGNPFGLEVTASAGIVSALGITDREAVVGPKNYRSFMQTDAAIHPGNSGGPVLNTSGQVVGMATASDTRVTGVGYVIPINRIKDIFPMLKSHGKVTRAWLGVLTKPINEELATRLGLPTISGAYVTQVIAGGPAAKARIAAGDVILKFGRPSEKMRDVDMANLPWLIASTGPNQDINLEVWRRGAPIQITLRTERLPE